MNRNTWIIFGVVCIAILGGLVALSRQSSVDVSSIDETKFIAANDANGNIADHTIGNKESKTLLIEYGDFQCPACQSAYPNIKELVEEFQDDILFIFRNNPITQIHPNARAGSAAAEAAGLQDKYWEMHDMLYEKQSDWSQASSSERLSIFEGYAKEIDVKDIDKFKSDMESSAVNNKINFDLALGKKVPVTGTPTILLNGEKIESDVWGSKDKFKSAIENALN